MKLLFTLPAVEQTAVEPLLQGEAIQYCVPYDLTLDGEIIKNGWLAVTFTRLFLFFNHAVAEIIPLEKGVEILCANQIGGGIIIHKTEAGERAVCRFSMRHIVRCSYAARGATLFCRGETRILESIEKEEHCPDCGKAMRGAKNCIACSGTRNFGRFWTLCRGYAAPLLVITLFMGAISGLTIYQQQFNRSFIDNVLIPAAGGWREIGIFFLIIFSITILSLTLSISRSVWSNFLGTRISRDLRARVFNKINMLSLSFIDTRQAGELMNRVTNDTRQVRQFMEEVFAGMFTQAFIMVGATIMMLYMDWKLALLTVSLTPLIFFMVQTFRRREMRLWRKQVRFGDRVNTRLQDVISGIRVVKSFGQEKRETDRFQDYTLTLRRYQINVERFWATFYPLLTYLMTVGSFFVLYFGGKGVLEGLSAGGSSKMTVGWITQFSAYASMLYGPIGWLTRLPRMLMQLSTALERIYDILDEEPDIADHNAAKRHVIAGRISFENMSFGYKTYEPVLDKINFTVEPGEMIGLVGPSGAGKSTLINLVMRLYDVDDGRICIDGVDLRDISKESLHSQIGVVLQETYLFTGTIYDNIRFAKPDATHEEIITATKMANAHDFITKCADGYNTYVGEHGYTLSGGERQRIAIARAILHDPKLLILDEATSSLDTETEFQIQQALERLTAGRTTFAIAHRLSTLRNADRIVVIDNHKVAEIGTHNELIRQKGIYFGLVTAQLDMHKTRG